MLSSALLCCAVLCCAMLGYAALMICIERYAMLQHAVPQYTIPNKPGTGSAGQQGALQDCSVLLKALAAIRKGRVSHHVCGR